MGDIGYWIPRKYVVLRIESSNVSWISLFIHRLLILRFVSHCCCMKSSRKPSVAVVIFVARWNVYKEWLLPVFFNLQTGQLSFKFLRSTYPNKWTMNFNNNSGDLNFSLVNKLRAALKRNGSLVSWSPKKIFYSKRSPSFTGLQLTYLYIFIVRAQIITPLNFYNPQQKKCSSWWLTVKSDRSLWDDSTGNYTHR